jgi:hypothetical protein
MKTIAFHSVRRPLALLACAGLGLATSLSAATKEPAYENYIDLAAGYSLQSGDRAAFQRALQMRKDGFFGIEDLRYAAEINDTTSLKLRGQALAGNGDYLLDIAITKEDVGYLKFGYKQFRTYYDGSGGVWPATGQSFKIFNEDMHIDRSNLWFEVGVNRPEAPSVVLRYDYITRKGEKGSTSWADSGLLVSAANTRYIVPAFWKIDEKRHVVQGDLTKKNESYAFGLGVRLDKGDYDNARYVRRRVAEPTADRFVTNREGQDSDLFQIRGSYAVDLNEQIKLTTAVARTKIDTILSGSRVVGANWDAAYSESYPGKQARDEGFFALPGHHLGEAEMTQTIANLSLLYRPLEHLAIVPALRFEKTEWANEVEFIETNFNPVTVTIREDVLAESEKHWKTYNYGVEMRYTGIANMTFNARADASTSEGGLDELRVLEPGTTHEIISVSRDTELTRDTQKVAFTTNWYPRQGVTVAAQYYFKARQNDYDAIRDTTPNTITSSDRYPAYIANQDIETNDFNVRLTWRLSPTFRTVTRWDYMKTTISTQDVGLPYGESMNVDQNILSESITWNPLPRWYVQANVNLTSEEMTTPAVFATATAANLVTVSNNDYVSYNVASGYALDDQSDVYVDYTSYEVTDNFVNNSAVSVPYGTLVKTDILGLTYKRQLDRRTSIQFRYAYVNSEDPAFNGKANYEANVFQAKLQYRF